jgi:hypothetical protein
LTSFLKDRIKQKTKSKPKQTKEMKTRTTSSLLIAKRLACAIAALAMLMLTCTQAQADFKGTFQRDLPYQILVDNTGNLSDETASGTVYYLSARKIISVEIFTIPGGEGVGPVFTIPKGTSRIIIEVDATFGKTTPITVNQGETSFGDAGVGGGRLVIDVL